MAASTGNQHYYGSDQEIPTFPSPATLRAIDIRMILEFIHGFIVCTVAYASEMKFYR